MVASSGALPLTFDMEKRDRAAGEKWEVASWTFARRRSGGLGRGLGRGRGRGDDDVRFGVLGGVREPRAGDELGRGLRRRRRRGRGRGPCGGLGRRRGRGRGEEPHGRWTARGLPSPCTQARRSSATDPLLCAATDPVVSVERMFFFFFGKDRTVRRPFSRNGLFPWAGRKGPNNQKAQIFPGE